MSLEDLLYEIHYMGLRKAVMEKLGNPEYKNLKMEILEKTEKAYTETLIEAKKKGILETINWDSSMIKSTTYNSETQTLLVTFHNDANYLYEEVGAEDYSAFKNAESKGKYFITNIRNNKTFNKDA
jgi:hypothetical protein